MKTYDNLKMLIERLRFEKLDKIEYLEKNPPYDNLAMVELFSEVKALEEVLRLSEKI